MEERRADLPPWEDLAVSLLRFDCIPCLGLPAYLLIIVPKAAAVLTYFCRSCLVDTGERLCFLLASCGSKFLRTDPRESLRLRGTTGATLVDGETKFGLAGVVDFA